MSDTIYRQAAIDLHCEICGRRGRCNPDICVDMELFRNLPSAQLWIPCSERLPEEDVEVLVTDDAGGMATILVDGCGKYEDGEERFWYFSQNVTAWMPLPEPYKGGEEDARTN